MKGPIGPVGPKGSQVSGSRISAVILKVAVSDLSRSPFVYRGTQVYREILESKETRYEELSSIFTGGIHKNTSLFEMSKETFVFEMFEDTFVCFSGSSWCYGNQRRGIMKLNSLTLLCVFYIPASARCFCWHPSFISTIEIFH